MNQISRLLLFFTIIFFCFSCNHKSEQRNFTYSKCNLDSLDVTNFDNLCSNIQFENGHTQYYKVDIHSNTPQEMYFWLFNNMNQKIEIHIIEDNKNIKSYYYGWFYDNFPNDREKGLSIPFNVSPHKSNSILFLIADGGWPINNGFEIHTKKAYFKTIKTEFSIKTICRSLLIILMIIGLFFIFQLKKSIFIIYLLNLLFGVLYFETEYGITSSIINIGEKIKFILIGDTFLYHTSSFVLYSLILFPNSQKAKSIRKVIMLFGFSFGFIILISMLTYGEYTTPYYQNLFVTLSLSYVLLIDVGIISLIYQGFKKKKKLTLYACAVFLITNLVIIIFSILPNANLTPKFAINRYIFFVMTVADMIAYLFLLLFQTSKLIHEKNKLLFQKKKIEQSLPFAYHNSQESERKKITSTLDKVVVQALLDIDGKLNATSEENIQNSLEKTIAEVRDLSHGLVTEGFNNISLEDILIDLVFKTKYEHLTVFFEFSSLENHIQKDLKIKAYIMVKALLDDLCTLKNSQEIYLSTLHPEENKDIINIYYESISKNNQIEFENVSNQSKRIITKINFEQNDLGTYIEIKL